MNLGLLLATFGTVLIAELIGDKAVYTIGTLAARFRPAPVFIGIALAFMGKMLAAVLIGRAIADLPAALLAAVSATTFLGTATVLWFKKPETSREEEPLRFSSRALMVSFAAIFFSEWGDIGQIATATLAARYQAPVVVWLGATSALIVKGTLALTLGLGMRRYLPSNVLRYGAVAVCVGMGILAAVRLEI